MFTATRAYATETESGHASHLNGEKELGFRDVTIKGYAIPVCGEEGVALENSTESGTMYVAGTALYVSAEQALGRLRSPKITCFAMEINATSPQFDGIGAALYWQDYLDNFDGTWLVAEGRPHYGPYAMYRFTHSDGYVQYIAAYPRLDNVILISVGAMPRQEDLIRDIIAFMMLDSGLGRPGIN